ncbi:uncharacterized protein B0H18DRAFT_954896 [Fomitopsis serialis]|uniref:uncharacterized protein n=1 Tax=Fomitopsis serialis TaxID=139415 RepID=UPI002008C70B|nr:uncharacterized protein B0H18DRAFT_954896 [Neoantrodia serialis]KAH9925998.1 hypothetical protein B0H18DRAFT_954896 [Neoantrodia serialis]
MTVRHTPSYIVCLTLKTTLTTVYETHDPVSTIQITTTVLAICILSVNNGHTLPAEPSRGAYLADMLHRFDEHLATLRRKEMRDAVQYLSPAAVYRLGWVLSRMSWYDIYDSLGTTETLGRDAMMSTNHIARRLQWLLGCDEWTPPGTVQGFRVYLQWCMRRTQQHLEDDHGIDPKDWDSKGWLGCAPDEPESEGNQHVDPPQTTDSESTSEAVDEQDPPEPQTGSPTRSMTQPFVDAVHRLEGSTAQEPDIEMQVRGAGSNTTPDASHATDTAPPAISGATPMTARTLDVSPQEQDAAQTSEHPQPLNAIEPRVDDLDASRGVAEHGADADEGRQGADADEGRQGGLVGAAEHADEHQGGDARPSQEGLASPDDTPTQPPESHFESASQNAHSG